MMGFNRLLAIAYHIDAVALFFQQAHNDLLIDDVVFSDK